jgi:hypothetical protein
MRAFILLSASVLAACSGGPQTLEDIERAEAEANRAALLELRDRGAARRAAEPASEGSAAATQVPTLPTVVLRPDTGPPALTPDGALRREAVVAFHERGPHALLGAVELLPAPGGGAFQLGTIDARDGAFVTSAGLRTGDVVRRVNGHGIVDPDAFLAAWDGIVDADELVVVGERDGQPLELRWPIVDAP